MMLNDQNNMIGTWIITVRLKIQNELQMLSINTTHKLSCQD